MRALALGLHALNLAAVAGLLFLCQQLLRAHDALAAMAVLGVAGLLVLLQFSKRLQAWRYVMPGVSAVLVFIVLPMAFTLGIAFTNSSSAHLLSFERATDALLQAYDGAGRTFMRYETLHGAFHDVPAKFLMAEMARLYPQFLHHGSGRLSGGMESEVPLAS